MLNSRKQLPYIILLLVMFTFWLRVWQLDSVPPGLWFDEAYNIMDTVWWLKAGGWSVFLLGNHGREAMFHYLLLLPIIAFGETIYGVRLVPVLLSTLSIPLIYRWTLVMFWREQDAKWIALISATGLAVSFVYLVMNRAVYRANLLPLFVIFTSYFFWRGWQTNKNRYYGVAGLGLGLSMYTYLSARLLPLVFMLFIVIESLLLSNYRSLQVKKAWMGLLIMTGGSILVTIPLFLFFLNHPEAFLGRTGDVFIIADGRIGGLQDLGSHFLDAVRVFVDNEDPNWRHHLLGRPGFDWFNSVGFWIGLVVAIKNFHRPNYLFLLVSLFVMWLPAPLSTPAFQSLRLSGMLPSYYALVALGLLRLVKWILKLLLQQRLRLQAGLITFFLLLLISGGQTIYDYFFDWARLPEVYEAYNGQLVDVAEFLVSQEVETSFLIPFNYYTHPSMRYILNQDFKEEKVLLPPSVLAKLSQHEKISLVIPEDTFENDQLPTFVLLVKNSMGRGTAYISQVSSDLLFGQLKLEAIHTVVGRRGNPVAKKYMVDTRRVLPLFSQKKPQSKVSFEWADNLILSGYEFVPVNIEPGQESFIDLSWELLGYKNLKARMFLQLIDSQGNPVGQQEIDPFSKQLYRWRQENYIIQRHPLNFPPDVNAGLYLVRLGFFDPKTGERLPVYDPQHRLPRGYEVILGPVYVRRGEVDPTVPKYPVRAQLSGFVELLGYSVLDQNNTVGIQLYWKVLASVKQDYTVFVQLLDSENKVIAQQDAQPLAGLFPTSRWQIGDVIVDKFILQLPLDQESGEHQLVTGMYDLASGERLPAYDEEGKLLPNNMIVLTNE